MSAASADACGRHPGLRRRWWRRPRWSGCSNGCSCGRRLHGRGLQVSLGYFLLPLTMILAGRLVFRERLSRLQGVAAGCAALGVLNELVRLGSFSWEALLVALGYPLYFILRRKLRTDHLGGLWCDMLLLLPVALYFIGGPGLPLAELARHARLFALLPLLGAMCALALIAYVLASRLLSFSLFGLLGYVEPVLLVLVALLLGETIRPGEWLTYIPIWLAVGVLVLEGGLHLLKRQRVRRASRQNKSAATLAGLAARERPVMDRVTSDACR